MTLFEFWDEATEAVDALYTPEAYHELLEWRAETYAEAGMGWVTSGYNPADAGCYAWEVVREREDRRPKLPWNFFD